MKGEGRLDMKMRKIEEGKVTFNHNIPFHTPISDVFRIPICFSFAAAIQSLSVTFFGSMSLE